VKKLLVIVFTFIINSCGSSEIVRSTDVCSIKKHVQDDIYQVRINEKPVNERWYLKEDAEEIRMILGVQNKCIR
jgi:peroxiredoxin